MVDNCVSISADLHLAKTLDALKSKEDGERKLLVENEDLKDELHQAKNAKDLLTEENKQLKLNQRQMCSQVDELKHTVENLQQRLQDESQQKGGAGGGAIGSTRNGDGKQSRCQRCADMDRELARLKSANNEVSKKKNRNICLIAVIFFLSLFPGAETLIMGL